jgi:ubiquinone/menaquinone biosynthesis C-methylase UbiE
MNESDGTMYPDITLGDVVAAYSGPVGVLWEMLMGEEIHLGGWETTEELAVLAGVEKDALILDVCSALGGSARHLAKRFGCQVVGLDATPAMVREAERRTDEQNLSTRVRYRLGNALVLPFPAGTFDIVWGQDAWCYITDKRQLIGEAHRVLRPGGTIAFTDWIQTSAMPDAVRETLHRFMLFPSTETIGGYTRLLEEAGFSVIRAEDSSESFPLLCRHYHHLLTGTFRDDVCTRFGDEFYATVEEGLRQWIDATEKHLMGQGRWIARKDR